METLVINIPDKKSILVKQILKALGVTIKSEEKSSLKPSGYVNAINVTKEDAQKMINDIAESRDEWERDI